MTRTPSSPKRAWLWWSSGKDSAWTLRTLRARPDVSLERLVTTVSRPFDRVSMHGVRSELVRRQAESLGVELHIIELPYPCPNERYEAVVRTEVEAARAEGIEMMAFGDLHLQDVRAYRENLLRGTGVTPTFPLWGRDTRGLAHEMVASGLRAIVTCIDPAALPEEFIGRTFDPDFLTALPDGVDPCGEHGEFHTFVHAGPMLSSPLAVRTGRVVERDGFLFIDLQLADAEGDA